jgi:hypothetical protein
MKHVWVKACTCSVTAATTDGALLPTVVTAMPEPKSISELPSASTTTPPRRPRRTRQRGADAAGDGSGLAGLKRCERARDGCHETTHLRIVGPPGVMVVNGPPGLAVDVDVSASTIRVMA